MPKFIIKITDTTADTFVKDTNVDCFLVSSDLPRDYITSVVGDIKQEEKLVLFDGENAVDVCLEMGGDGIVADLTNSKQIKKEMSILRNKLGKLVLGVISRNRRHEAMVVSENEPEFVIFKVWEDGKEQTLTLSQWYAELFFLQQAISIEDDIADYREYNADMVIITPQRYKILVAQN